VDEESLLSRGERTISITIYVPFDPVRYVTIMVINAMEYSAPHSIITRKIG